MKIEDIKIEKNEKGEIVRISFDREKRDYVDVNFLSEDTIRINSTNTILKITPRASNTIEIAFKK